MAWLLMPVLLSCATYNTKMQGYYRSLSGNRYERALSELENNHFIHAGRNRLLYYLEKGQVYRLMGRYDSSNLYLNQADGFIENTRKNVGDVVKANLLNPMLQTYTGEDFEQFIMHYYKALNYVALGQTEDALVEARRITLASDRQDQKMNSNEKRYSKDAFALNLQGMLYEMAGDINNAFISYRNAVDIYLQASGTYYGVDMPDQLKQDLLRTARQMDFEDEFRRYSSLLHTDLQADTATGGHLVLFLEQGTAPVKKENRFFIATSNAGVNGFYYIDATGNNVSIPFNYGYYNLDGGNFRSVRAFNVAIPAYEQVSRYYPVPVTVNGSNQPVELAEDINTLAQQTLQQRMLTELANAIARQLVKKLAEKGVEASAKSVANNSKDSDSKEEKERKQRNAETVGEVAGLLMNLVNNATEKADTRNWQSVPAYISYVRIPLKEGINNITVQGNTFTITGNGSLQMLSRRMN